MDSIFTEWNNQSITSIDKPINYVYSDNDPDPRVYTMSATIDHFIEPVNEMQLELSINSSSISFFHFGCWGLGEDYDSENPTINNHFKEIIRLISQNPKLYFGIIAGDNLYKKDIVDQTGHIYSIYKKSILNDGIDLLQQLRLPIFSVVGNHDIYDCQVLYDQIDRTKIIVEQGQLTIDPNNIGWIMPHNYYNLYLHLQGHIVHFIFIDTNLFNDYVEDCYGKHDQNYSRKTRLNLMLKWLEHILKNNIGHTIIIVGHVYLFGYVRPNDMFGNKINDMDDKLITLRHVGKLLKILHAFVTRTGYNRKIYYLCADIHNYQYIKFVGQGEYQNLEINNIIAGIGGGIPDPLPISECGTVSEYKENGVALGTIELVDKGDCYGYLQHCLDSNGILHTAYVGIENNTIKYYQ
jgi:hypothetical protein